MPTLLWSLYTYWHLVLPYLGSVESRNGCIVDIIKIGSPRNVEVKLASSLVIKGNVWGEWKKDKVLNGNVWLIVCIEPLLKRAGIHLYPKKIWIGTECIFVWVVVSIWWKKAKTWHLEVWTKLRAFLIILVKILSEATMYTVNVWSHVSSPQFAIWCSLGFVLWMQSWRLKLHLCPL